MLFAILIMKSILSLNAVLRHQLSLASLDIVMVSFFYYVQANFSPLQLYFEKIEMSLSIILKFLSIILKFYRIAAWTIALL